MKVNIRIKSLYPEDRQRAKLLRKLMRVNKWIIEDACENAVKQAINGLVHEGLKMLEVPDHVWKGVPMPCGKKKKKK